MITEVQARRINGRFLSQRGSITISNLDPLNTILHVAENRYTWSALLKRFGR